MRENKFIGASFHGVKLSMLFTIIQKVITFSLNQLLLIYTSPDLLGVSAIQLELLLSTLSLSREGIRLTSIRESIESKRKRQQLVNLSYIPSMMIILVANIVLIFSYFNIKIGYNNNNYNESNNNNNNNNNNENKINVKIVLLYCLGAFLESLGEPFVNLYQNSIQIQPKLRAETIAIFTKSCITFICIVYFQFGLLSFGLAQVVYGLIYLIVIAEATRRTPIHGCILNVKDFLPNLNNNNNNNNNSNNSNNNNNNSNSNNNNNEISEDEDNNVLNYKMLRFAWTTTLSSIVKHILTEADRITLSLTVSSYDQGLFALANNYGSFLTRLLFLPIEDSSRMAFSKLAADIKRNDSTEKTNNLEIIQSMADLFKFLFHSISTFILIFPTFGPNYVKLFVDIIFSKKWKSQETVQTLGCYCFYLYSLGINGISESFVHATAPTNKFWRLNFGLITGTLIYIAIAIPLVKQIGTPGIIIAGSISMLVRTISSLLYVKSCFDSKHESKDNLLFSSFKEGRVIFNIYSLFPNYMIIITALFSYLITKYSSKRHEMSQLQIKDHITHLIIGVICFIIFSIVLFLNTKKDLIKLYNLIFGKEKYT